MYGKTIEYTDDIFSIPDYTNGVQKRAFNRNTKTIYYIRGNRIVLCQPIDIISSDITPITHNDWRSFIWEQYDQRQVFLASSISLPLMVLRRSHDVSCMLQYGIDYSDSKLIIVFDTRGKVRERVRVEFNDDYTPGCFNNEYQLCRSISNTLLKYASGVKYNRHDFSTVLRECYTND